MKNTNYFLHQVYNHYHDYYQLDRAQRHHILIHVMILVAVICGLMPMIISITNNVSFKSVAYPTFFITILLLLWGRDSYKKGKLDKYKSMDY